VDSKDGYAVLAKMSVRPSATIENPHRAGQCDQIRAGAGQVDRAHLTSTERPGATLNYCTDSSTIYTVQVVGSGTHPSEADASTTQTMDCGHRRRPDWPGDQCHRRRRRHRRTRGDHDRRRLDRRRRRRCRGRRRLDRRRRRCRGRWQGPKVAIKLRPPPRPPSPLPPPPLPRPPPPPR
jgi:hypothetical protein